MPRGKVQPRRAGASNETSLDDPAVRDAIDSGRPWALVGGGQGREPEEVESAANVVASAVLIVGLLLTLALAFAFWPESRVAAGAVMLPLSMAWTYCRTPGCERVALGEDYCRGCTCEMQDVDETAEIDRVA